MQFHPLAYTVKLMIEMSMANLIRKVASEKNDMGIGGYELSISTGTANQTRRNHVSQLTSNGGVVVHKEVIVESRALEDQVSETSGKEPQEDDSPLRNETWGRVTYNTDISSGGAHGHNNVWATTGLISFVLVWFRIRLIEQ